MAKKLLVTDDIGVDEAKVTRVLQKLVVEGDDDLSEEERGLLWRKPVGLFTQAADELRQGCIYKCVDVLADDGFFVASLTISETSLLHRCFPFFVFKSPFRRVDKKVFIQYDFTLERDKFAEQFEKSDFLTLGTYYLIKFDARVGPTGMYIKDVLFVMKYTGSYI